MIAARRCAVLRCCQHRQGRGFTLIEILVVLLILSITTLFAVLAIGGAGRQQALSNQAQRLQALLQLAKTQALLQPAVIGLAVSQHSYRFLYYVAPQVGSAQAGQWRTYPPGNALGTVRLATQQRLAIEVAGKSLNLPEQLTSALPAVVFSMTGAVTPFIAQLTGGKDRYMITGSDSGDIVLRH